MWHAFMNVKSLSEDVLMMIGLSEDVLMMIVTSFSDDCHKFQSLM